MKTKTWHADPECKTCYGTGIHEKTFKYESEWEAKIHCDCLRRGELTIVEWYSQFGAGGLP